MEGKKINKNKTNKKVREWEKVNKNQEDYSTLIIRIEIMKKYPRYHQESINIKMH